MCRWILGRVQLDTGCRNRGLRALARRLRQLGNLERVERRIQTSGWLGIAITRLIPGMRIYTTLVAGGLRARVRSFFLAMVSSTMLWIGVYVTLGIVIGAPVDGILNEIQKVALQVALVIVVGIGCYITVRKVRSANRARLSSWFARMSGSTLGSRELGEAMLITHGSSRSTVDDLGMQIRSEVTGSDNGM